MVVQTLIPILLSVFLYTASFIHSRCYGAGATIRGRYFAIFLTITYLVLPSVTVVISGAIPCVSVDPDGLHPETPMYLRNDFSISCSSSKYFVGVVWAGIMFIVYPVGVLSLYGCLLYHFKDKIMNRNDGTADETISTSDVKHSSYHETVQPKAGPDSDLVVDLANIYDREPEAEITSISRNRFGIGTFADDLKMVNLKFLYGNYAKQFWYWELVETVRKLLLTAVLSIIEPGTLYS
jgi:hypothetical protein